MRVGPPLGFHVDPIEAIRASRNAYTIGQAFPLPTAGFVPPAAKILVRPPLDIVLYPAGPAAYAEF
ncbi:hypothetical protein OIU34_18310 [Pararhizobium sp. BT-229]|uniref:hypothetical protein n=1 Tax=Pararhizobium sp. BT-229 TaxID=2986923 RepID=UPI0021F6E73D|nr:hypothetical protein [Pararhizobium sp. BT-229]MCV9963834.1 hypothetical protein [Pararhizobium sp. BT-229]